LEHALLALFMATNVKVLPAEKGSPAPARRSSTQHFQYVWANKKMTRDEAQEIQREAKEAKNYAVKEINHPKRAHNYNVNSPLAILIAWTGTFWPLVVRRYELYLYPLIHIGLVAYMGAWFNQEGTGVFWEDPRNMVPWASLSLLSPLMIFFLVFFLSQCYNRFNSFFDTAMSIEKSVQDVTMLMLAHVTDPAKAELRWDAVRYLTAAAMVIYARVTKIAQGKDAQMNIENWGRLLKRERVWQSEGGDELPLDTWERMMGWPRTHEDEQNYQNMMRAAFADVVPDGDILSSDVPERRSTCPPLLTPSEVNRLRRYPGGMLSLVLCTWSMQVIVAADLKGPALGAAQGAVLSMKTAAYALRNELGMPVPMPYFHSLTMLQNINFALYSYALCTFESYLTPVILFTVVLITVGMREVAVALSNPYGTDDVDFPVNKWVVAQLRALALVVHPDNFVISCPKLFGEDIDAVMEL